MPPPPGAPEAASTFPSIGRGLLAVVAVHVVVVALALVHLLSSHRLHFETLDTLVFLKPMPRRLAVALCVVLIPLHGRLVFVLRDMGLPVPPRLRRWLVALSLYSGAVLDLPGLWLMARAFKASGFPSNEMRAVSPVGTLAYACCAINFIVCALQFVVILARWVSDGGLPRAWASLRTTKAQVVDAILARPLPHWLQFGWMTNVETEKVAVVSVTSAVPGPSAAAQLGAVRVISAASVVSGDPGAASSSTSVRSARVQQARVQLPQHHLRPVQAVPVPPALDTPVGSLRSAGMTSAVVSVYAGRGTPPDPAATLTGLSLTAQSTTVAAPRSLPSSGSTVTSDASDSLWVDSPLAATPIGFRAVRGGPAAPGASLTELTVTTSIPASTPPPTLPTVPVQEREDIRPDRQ
jgi:hypothetical protein